VCVCVRERERESGVYMCEIMVCCSVRECCSSRDVCVCEIFVYTHYNTHNTHYNAHTLQHTTQITCLRCIETHRVRGDPQTQLCRPLDAICGVGGV
jgi:hypothetical protein